MPTDHEQPQRRCPVCWTLFVPNNPANPHPRRYCSGACRIEDSEGPLIFRTTDPLGFMSRK